MKSEDKFEALAKSYYVPELLKRLFGIVTIAVIALCAMYAAIEFQDALSTNPSCISGEAVCAWEAIVVLTSLLALFCALGAIKIVSQQLIWWWGMRLVSKRKSESQ